MSGHSHKDDQSLGRAASREPGATPDRRVDAWSVGVTRLLAANDNRRPRAALIQGVLIGAALATALAVSLALLN